MKTIALGDTHGRTNWKDIVAKETFDKVVFIGDYLDTHDDVSGATQLENLKEIIAYKKENMDKVVLLIGNHDFHYLATSKNQYSGFQRLFKLAFQEQLHKAIDENLLQACYIQGDTIFTHAGVTQTWCEDNNIDFSNLEQSINDLFKFKPNRFEFSVGENMSEYGDDITQTPIWVRPDSLIKDKIKGYYQVVGHTTQDKIMSANGVVFIDTLGTSGEYLEIIDGTFAIVNPNK
jgi:predicted MPP superfamily phosphohydrolase